MGKLSPEERPAVGSLANVVKQEVQTSLEQRKQDLQRLQIEARIKAETIDVTMPGVSRPLGRVHPLNGCRRSRIRYLYRFGLYRGNRTPNRDRLL